MQKIAEELNILKEKGSYREIPQISSRYGDKVVIDGTSYTNFASNDYLSISTKENLTEEFLSATEVKQFSSASARLLSGTSEEFKSLENTLSRLFKRDAALIYNTGYQCNLGVITALAQKGDVIFSDKLNHASIIDGMRLSGCDFFRYKHLDYDNLEKMLKEKREQYKRAIIISESVFSMDGDIADIDKLVDLKNKYNCLLMIDEAHAFCAAGENLAGIGFNKDIDITTATFGKALASFGAFAVTNDSIKEYLVNKSRSFIFSTALPPINIAWTNWLLNNKRDYLIECKTRLNNLSGKAHKLLDEFGFKTPSDTHIIPIITGSNENTLKVSEKLKSLGYYIPAIRPPTVKEGESRLRISLCADSKIEDFAAILEALQ